MQFSPRSQIRKLLLPIAAVILFAFDSAALACPVNFRQPGKPLNLVFKADRCSLISRSPDCPQKQELDEVAAALASSRGFKMLAKFSGLPAAERQKLKSDFLPELGSPAIVANARFSDRLSALIAKLLALHNIADQTEIVIVRSRVPTMLTWKLTFVTMTTAALSVLSDDEVIALAAHEIGHLYYATGLSQARVAGDDRKARIIELQADIVALETLALLDLPPSSLLSGVRRLIDARTALGIKSFSAASPTIEDRAKLVSAYLDRH